MFEMQLSGPSGYSRILKYSSETSSAEWEDGTDLEIPEQLTTIFKNEGLAAGKPKNLPKEAKAFGPENPAKKKKDLAKIKIQLGLLCNYSCSYCNQATQVNPKIGRLSEVDPFIENMPKWYNGGENGKGLGTTFEFWGGEPFIYWKTLKPLADSVRALYPDCNFSIITNGSLFTDEMVDWLDTMNVSVGVSHDGPLYEAGRGDDPLFDPEKREMIKKLYLKLHPKNKISFNCVLTKASVSLSSVRLYIARALGIEPEDLPLSTEGIVLPYNQGGKDQSLNNGEALQTFVQNLVNDNLFSKHSAANTWHMVKRNFFKSLAYKTPSKVLGQKCGMDREDSIAVDLKGNVMTCQNTSPDKGHKIGQLDKFEDIKLTTARHWSSREGCAKCPVLHLCRGSCMYLEDDLWDLGCDNSLAYNLSIMTCALYELTGLVLTEIRGKDIRGRGVDKLSVVEVLPNGMPKGYETFLKLNHSTNAKTAHVAPAQPSV